MNKQDLHNMADGLDSVSNSGRHPLNSNLAYAVNKNLRVIDKELSKNYPQMLVTPEKRAYNEKYEAVCSKYAKRNPDGSLVKNKSGIVIADQKGFDEAFSKLKEQYPKEEKAIQDDNAKYAKYLKEEVNIKIHKVLRVDVANVTPRQYGGIEFMIK